MKHRQIGINKVGVVNADGHAIGLDIGASAVRAAVLSPGTHEGRPSVTVHGIGHIELPEGAVVNGVVMERATITAALKQLWQVNKFECRNVILGITNQQVVVRDMSVPNLRPGSAAQGAALPGPRDRRAADGPGAARLLPARRAGHRDQHVHGLLIATPRQPVLTAVTAVERPA